MSAIAADVLTYELLTKPFLRVREYLGCVYARFSYSVGTDVSVRPTEGVVGDILVGIGSLPELEGLE